MANRRRFAEELVYPEWHRSYLPEVYRRLGHRLDTCDRDFTEYCHYCRQPFLIYETVLDYGQNLNDKATTVTRKLAERANLSAWLVAYRVERPEAVQRELDALHARQLELMRPEHLSGFRVKRLRPDPAAFGVFTPPEFAHELLIQHRWHHLRCPLAREFPVKLNGLEDALGGSRLFRAIYPQMPLWPEWPR